MTVDYGIDGERLEQIRRRAIRDRDSVFSAGRDRRTLLWMVDRLIEVMDKQAAALRLLQDGIGDIRTEIIKDM